MEELVKLVINSGTSAVIVGIFLWDYVTNRKEMKETLESIKTSNINIANCLALLQKALDNTTEKIDKLLEERRGR